MQSKISTKKFEEIVLQNEKLLKATGKTEGDIKELVKEAVRETRKKR